MPDAPSRPIEALCGRHRTERGLGERGTLLVLTDSSGTTVSSPSVPASNVFDQLRNRGNLE
jgi:hypothetical protein